MNRRDALKQFFEAAGVFLLGNRLSYGESSKLVLNSGLPIYSGWIDDSVARENFIQSCSRPFLSQQNDAIKDTGKGKVVLLYKFFEEVIGGPLVPHRQAAADCVAHTFGLGIDVLTAVQIMMHKQPEYWITKCATEIIYGGSRVEASTRRLRSGGSTGVWAAKFVKDWGVLLRQVYLGGKYDYTKYSGSVARTLGKKGVPDDLEPICREHPVKACAIVRTWKECRDSIANGYPVAMCSKIGFNKTRDKDGFLRRSRRPWYHAMIILGIDDKSNRPGGLLQNSWGTKWVSGPTRHDQPVGSFWADAKVIERGLKQGDSIALSGYVGYPRVAIPEYQIW